MKKKGILYRRVNPSFKFIATCSLSEAIQRFRTYQVPVISQANEKFSIRLNPTGIHRYEFYASYRQNDDLIEGTGRLQHQFENTVLVEGHVNFPWLYYLQLLGAEYFCLLLALFGNFWLGLAAACIALIPFVVMRYRINQRRDYLAYLIHEILNTPDVLEIPPWSAVNAPSQQQWLVPYPATECMTRLSTRWPARITFQARPLDTYEFRLVNKRITFRGMIIPQPENKTLVRLEHWLIDGNCMDLLVVIGIIMIAMLLVWYLCPIVTLIGLFIPFGGLIALRVRQEKADVIRVMARILSV